VGDEELALAARDGSPRAMDELWRRYQRRLFLFVRRRVSTEQDAEDIVQDSFIKAMRYIDRFDGQYRFSSWLYTLCQQLIISHYRRRKDLPLDQDLAQSKDGPAESAESESLRERLWQLASALPAKQFDVIWLRYVEEMPVKEVARTLSLSGINVRVLLHRARMALMQAASLPVPVTAGDDLAMTGLNRIGVEP
jgi:RNA polymerase sigma-70 factor (ECF subfamily)